MTGHVIRSNIPKIQPSSNQLEGYGFVKNFGERYFFHVSQFASPRIPKVGDCVLIVPGKARPGSDKTPKVRRIEFDVEREKTEAKAANTSKCGVYDFIVGVLFKLAMRSIDFFFACAICFAISWFLSDVFDGKGYWGLFFVAILSVTWSIKYFTPEWRSFFVRDVFGGLLRKIYITNEQINTFFALILGLAMQYGLIYFVFWIFNKRQGPNFFDPDSLFPYIVVGFSVCWIYQFAPYVLGIRSYEEEQLEK